MIVLLKDLYGGKVAKGSTHNAVPCPPDKKHLSHLAWIHPEGLEPIPLLPSDYDTELPKKDFPHLIIEVIDGKTIASVDPIMEVKTPTLPLKGSNAYDLNNIKPSEETK